MGDVTGVNESPAPQIHEPALKKMADAPQSREIDPARACRRDQPL
jgi:hypothetical protein